MRNRADSRAPFISTDAGSVYVDGTGFPGGAPVRPVAETLVELQIVDDGAANKAVDVTMVEEISPRRAPRRNYG